MKIKALFLTLIAAVFSIVSCEELEGLAGLPSIELVGLESDVISFEADGGECQVALKANRKWTVNEDANWIEVDPKSGSASDEEQTVTIKVVKNENDDEDPTAGFDREAVIEFSVGAKAAYLTISQNGPQGSTDALIVYSNDFDKEKAEKVGDSGWTTYLDSFEGWKNETGTGLETVTYAYDRITARTNSSNGSAGGYSIYQGSGMNYLWLGSGKPYFSVKNITLPEGKVDFTISFGTERYLYEAPDNTFNWEEFKAYVSIDTVKWSLLPCEFAGESLPNGKWDLASATIRVPEGTKKLSLHFTSTMGSAYAIDDLKVEESLVEGTAIDFSAGVELTPDEGQQGGESDATAIYHNNYDRQEATKTYGSVQSYPYLDQFDGWMNAAGTGAANVSYAYTGMSVRSNSTSNSSYSDYAGSGLNNMFFGKSAYFSTNNIALNGAVNLTLTFGTEKYSQDNGSVFTNSEYHIWLSNDGKKWVELTDYTFAGGTKEGRWNVATANFSVPSGTETLSICMQVDVASSYRMDDLKLVASATAGTTVDFTQAVEKNFGGSGSSTTGTPESKGKKTVEEFIAAADTQNYYELTGTVSAFNAQYCSFDLTDASGKIYVYSVLDASKSEWAGKIVNGGTVTIYGKYLYYANKSQHEVVDAYIVSYNGEGGSTGDESFADAIYGNNFDKVISTKTFGSNGSSWPYLDQFEGWKNEVGTGAANVTYAQKSASARASSNNNNIWLPKTGAYFSIQDIALNGAASLQLSFSTICGSPGNYKKTFSSDVFKVYLSADKAKWVELPVNVTVNGSEFDSAVASFSVPSNTGSLSIAFEKIADETDGYRVDNVKLAASEVAGTAVDFSQGVEKTFGEGGSTGGTDTPPSGKITDVTVAQFNDKAVSTTDLYRLTGTVGGPINTTYGNFDVIDETGKVFVYGISNWSDYKDKVAEGGKITVVGQRGEYNGKIEVLEGYIESYDTSEGGSGETPAPEVPGSVVKATVAQFLAAAEGETVYELSGTITRIGVAYNSEYNNISYYISDPTGETYIFRMSCEGVADPTSLTVGDEITVQGKRASYNTVPQMAAGSKYVSHVDKAAPAPEAGAHMLDFSVVANRTSFTTSEQVWEQNGVKVTNNKAGSTSNIADYSAPARFYKSTSLKIEKTGMKKIIFYCNSGKNTGPADLQKSITDANVTVTVDGMNVTVTFANAVDVLEIASLAGQLRVDSLTVYTE